MSQFMPQLSALTSVWSGPASVQVSESVELLRANVMTGNDVLIDRQAGEVRTRMVSCPEQLRTPLASTLPYQLFLATLTGDESALAEPLAAVRQILSDGPSGETRLAAWESKWVGCRAAALETTFAAEKLLLQLQCDQLEALLSFAAQSPNAILGDLDEIRDLQGAVILAHARARNAFARNVFTRIADLAAQARVNSISPSELAWKAEYSADLLRQVAQTHRFALIGPSVFQPAPPLDLAFDASDEEDDVPPLLMEI